MPTYRFKNLNTNEEYEVFMSMSERESYMKIRPNVVQIFTPIALTGDHIMGIGPKPDSGFTESMQRIAEAHPSSPLAERYGSNESNALKGARSTVRKHMGKNI